MSIFSSKSKIDNNDIDVDVPVAEGYSTDVNGNMDACIEAFDDQLAVIEAMHSLDIAEIALEGKIEELKEEGADEEEVKEVEDELEKVTEASLKDIWNRILTMLQNLWSKIKAFFATIVAHFDALVKSGKDFATKYEKQVNGVKPFEYECFDWFAIDLTKEGGVIDKVINDVRSDVNGAVAGINNAKGDAIAEVGDKSLEGRVAFLDAVRGKLVGGDNVTADDFQQKAFEKLHGGDKTAKKERTVNVADAVNYLKGNNVADQIKKVKGSTDASFKEIVALIKKAASDAGRNERDDAGKTTSDGQLKVKYINKHVSHFSAAKSVINGYINMWKSAAGEKDRACRSIVLKALSNKNKDADKKEDK